MLNFIDISSHQEGLNLPDVQDSIDAVMVKATQGSWYVNPFCDKWVQQAIELGMPWGFYHYADDNDPEIEAEYFVQNCWNYFKHGIPALDWEENQSVDWVNKFVNAVYKRTGIWCWIYANSWRFNQGGVEANCARWVASHPEIEHPSFEQAKNLQPPETDGLVGAWQFCSDGIINGTNFELDCNLFYGDKKNWLKYAGEINSEKIEEIVLENEEYIATVRKK